MRPRIKSVMLVANSHDDSVLKKNQAIIDKVAHSSSKDNRPYVMIFDKKLYISPSEVDYYLNNGFDVYNPK